MIEIVCARNGPNKGQELCSWRRSGGPCRPTPRHRLAEISAAVWKGFAAGALSEDEAQHLAELIEARKAVPTASAEARRPVGSRPRSSASLERRRAWTGSGWMPPAIAARFTMGEGRGDRRHRGRDRQERPVRALHRCHRGQGRGLLLDRAQRAPASQVTRVCCTSRPGAWPAIDACRTS